MSMMPSPTADRKTIGKQPMMLLLSLCVLTLTACVSNVSSQVKESNKDQSGAFDGTWVAKVQKSAKRQTMPGNWIANCDGSAWNFTLRVNDGVVSNNLRESKKSTYVSSTGDFRFDIPVNNEASAAAGSERNISLAKQTLIVYGNLEKAKGRFTTGVAEFGNSGCTAIIEFARTSA
ncbi:hypothetical protein ACUNV4_14070 [Granulosicoccus sp. 3-233]|uniref:hypothetical protein n=1 Tax=Granulosicoccus sp. 3-233 TaxID=3417969 RepID=UPI003D34F4F8